VQPEPALIPISKSDSDEFALASRNVPRWVDLVLEFVPIPVPTPPWYVVVALIFVGLGALVYKAWKESAPPDGA
jgi:hypothetical protein